MPRDAAGIVTDERIGTGSDGVAFHCAVCGAFVTRPALALRMGGRHEHMLVNPAGIRFQVVCFKDAPGAVAVGSATGEFSWFTGFDWRVALCSACGAHLGWMYEGIGPPAVFFGLIRPMLVERPG